MKDPGLCADCAHGREIVSGRGSRFWLCRRSETDPAWPRYPALPVLRCDGFEDGTKGGGAPPASSEPSESL